MFGMGMGELVVVFLIILLLFGANRLPEMAQALGKSVREFKKAANELQSSVVLEAHKPAQVSPVETDKSVAG